MLGVAVTGIELRDGGQSVAVGTRGQGPQAFSMVNLPLPSSGAVASGSRLTATA